MEKFYQVIDLNDDGHGVVKIDGKVFFVPGTFVGEKIAGEIESENAKFGFLKLTKIKNKTAKRITPICPHFLSCGGCDFLHLKYEKQIEFKKQKFAKILNKLEFFGNFDIIPSDQNLFYRNKISYAVKNNKLCLNKKHTNEAVEIKKCFLASEKINIIAQKINNFLSQSKNNFEKVVIRDFDTSFFVEITSKNQKVDSLNLLVQSLQQLQQEFSVFLNQKVVFGKPQILVTIDDIVCPISQNTFLQVNDFVKSKLYKTAQNLTSEPNVINCFSGSGLLSAIFAKKAQNVFGIEINKQSHIDAQKLKNLNKIKNLTNICGDCTKEIDQIALKLDPNNTTIVFDPPRSGCTKKFLQSVLNFSPKQIIYISCEPITLSRDVKILSEKYQINSAKLFDMFPQTSCFESLVVLTKKPL